MTTESKEQQLLPCPFCGKPAELLWRGPGANEIQHIEGNGPVCRFMFQVVTWHRDVAIKSWNARTPDVERTELTALREKVKWLDGWRGMQKHLIAEAREQGRREGFAAARETYLVIADPIVSCDARDAVSLHKKYTSVDDFLRSLKQEAK